MAKKKSSYLQNRDRSWPWRVTCVCWEKGEGGEGEGRGGGGMNEEFGVGGCKLLHVEWMGNGVLLWSTGNCA